LLTGTIDPQGVNLVERNDAKDRLMDYAKAINKWLNKYENIKIVFVENSNYPQRELMDKLSQLENLEYLSFDGRNISIQKGKGFGEISCIEYAFKKSENVKNADYIIKCTGRLFFNKVDKIISFLENEDYEVVGNFRKNLDFLDSRIFIFTPHFFHNYFLNYKDKIDDSKKFYFEHALSCATHELLSKRRNAWTQLPTPLVIDGISGTHNIKYNSLIGKLRARLKFYLIKIIA
jgi:hypothetical protein